MSHYGSDPRLASLGPRNNSRTDLNSFRNDVFMTGNGYQAEFQQMEPGYSYQTHTKSSMYGGGGGTIKVSQGTLGPGAVSPMVLQQKAGILVGQSHEYLEKANIILTSGGSMIDAERFILMAGESLQRLNIICRDLMEMRIPSDAPRECEMLQHRFNSIKQKMAGYGTMKGNRGSVGSDGGRLLNDAISWINQQKRIIETTPFGDDSHAIGEQIVAHNRFHSSIQRSTEVTRAREELKAIGDKYHLTILEQEMDSLQKMSNNRKSQLTELQFIIDEVSRAIMWVNEKEEEELVFDWGDKNIDSYIPKKQESYSKLMRDLEEKEKELNKLKQKTSGLLSNNHPASDKIEAYMDTLQTQWSWLLQITKCIQVHLKENAAYSQFFKEANEINAKLQKQHETIRTKFICDKNTSLENLMELLKNLEKEKDRIMENKRHVHSLVSKSKSIVRLKPRNPEEKSTSPIMVEALCDFKQDQKGILKGNEGILKDNSQRSKWLVTGPGGLDMQIPSVCLVIPPPNPLSIGVASKNEQYYEAIMALWNQLFINIKSLIAWQYCLKDVNYINSLTLSMLSKMRPEEYRSIIKRLETHYQEFLRTSQGSDLFGEEDKKTIQGHFDKAQEHYDTLIIQLTNNHGEKGKPEAPKPEDQVPTKQPTKTTTVISLSLLTNLQEIRRRLEIAESSITDHLHVPLGENGVHQCSVHIQNLEGAHQDLESIYNEYMHLREMITKQLKGVPADSEQAKFLRSELEIINQKLGGLQHLYSIYIQRLTALKALLQSLLQAEDIIKVHEARLTEKETSSTDPQELENHRSALRNMKLELEQRRDLLTSMESNMAEAVHCNTQISESFHRCDVDLSKYSELVGQLSDRWRRIQNQIDSRMLDLDKQKEQLTQYQQDRNSMEHWIDNTRKRQDTLQTAKFTDIQMLNDYLNQQKALHNEIKAKKEKVEDVQRNADNCATSIKDYELQLASYSSGLETLLNVPIKRTLLQSPASYVRKEAGELQEHYIELLTRSSDYYKFLGDLLKNMEELKLRNTRIEMLEEDLRRLQDELQDQKQKNRSLEDTLANYKLELSQCKNELISVQEVKRTTVMQVNAAKESLDSTQGQIQHLNEELTRLKYQLEEEKRKRRLAEERYSSQQEEYEAAVRRRQKELEEVSWIKIDLEKSVKDKEREIERLKMQLEEEATRRRNAESDISKTSQLVHVSESKYSELQLERDSLLSRLKLLEQDKNRNQRLEEELARLKLSLETEIRSKQRLQDEKNSVLKEFTTIKSQYEFKETQIRQCESDRDKADRERLSLKNEIERLMRELNIVEERYKSRLMISEKEASELAQKRQELEREILRLKQRPATLNIHTQTDEKVMTIDPSKLVFDGVRRKVTAHQLCDCGIISKATLELLLNGKKTVEEVAVDIQLSLKGTGIIAGMVTGSHGKMPFTEAKHRNLIGPESALMLLEAQAATGYIVDPAFNERMPVDTACSRGIVDTEDRDILLKAEAASIGFKDPYTGKVLSVGQACKKGHVDKETAIRLLQAQESVGGIIDPVLSVFLPKDLALDRNLIDEDLYRALNKRPTAYLDPANEEKVTYSDLRRKCTAEPVSGLLLLRGPEKPMTVKGFRGDVSIDELVKSELLDKTDVEKLNQGKITTKDIEDKLKSYLYGSTCIAGIYDEANDRIMPLYQAMKEGLLMRGTTLELLEAQAASGFVVDPVNNVFLTVEEATKRGIVGKEFKNKLLSAEKAVTGYRDPGTGKTISLFQAIEKDIIERGHGIRLLEAQIASGGIIDPVESHRIDVSVAYKRGYFDEEMNEILTYEGDDTKGFFDPNTKENLTYLQLKERCIKDAKTGLILLPLKDKKKAQQTQESRTNVLRKRRVVIVDPDTGLEMSVREAYHKELIDYETFLDLSEQECEWEEITITGSDGTARLVIVDRKTGTQYDVQDCIDRALIDQKMLDQYRAGTVTLTELADKIASRTSSTEMTISTSSVDDMVTCSSPTQATPSSPTVRKRFNSISITVSPPGMFDDQSPVAAIFDTETLEKITILEALKRGIVDTITAQRLLEAQACTGGIINPATGDRLSLDDAVHQSILDENMASKLKAAQKAYVGFEDLKTKRKLSVAEAVKETWLPYEAGQRFMEFQYLTGGLIEPHKGRRISIEEAIRKGWLDGKGAQKLQESRNLPKNLTCPKTKLKISYKEAMDNCMVEEGNGMKMLQASSISSKGISSPYNVSNPGSRSGSRAGSRSGSRRGSVDYTSSYSYSFSSNSTTY
ncbi:desmoplakin-like isoform X2 [Cyprinodon tularosa]|uniref:desmoplakin-like isoform X2 n=1 Tax=Cyprinodon tularosa TaxID=77115 RepID=UPI0018E260A1|nr:desmoplakin-like isoform X2 [Cyprinodon tularosa]